MKAYLLMNIDQPRLMYCERFTYIVSSFSNNYDVFGYQEK